MCLNIQHTKSKDAGPREIVSNKDPIQGFTDSGSVGTHKDTDLSNRGLRPIVIASQISLRGDGLNADTDVEPK